MSGKYPNTFYRVSLKALIRNELGEVLVVKERGKEWDLPGGGLDHGESMHDALKRELYEEALITQPFEERLIASETMFVEHKDAWILWLIYEVGIDNLAFGQGADSDEVAFVDPEMFKTSPHGFEQWIYKYSKK